MDWCVLAQNTHKMHAYATYIHGGFPRWMGDCLCTSLSFGHSIRKTQFLIRTSSCATWDYQHISLHASVTKCVRGCYIQGPYWLLSIYLYYSRGGDMANNYELEASGSLLGISLSLVGRPRSINARSKSFIKSSLRSPPTCWTIKHKNNHTGVISTPSFC